MILKNEVSKSTEYYTIFRSIWSNFTELVPAICSNLESVLCSVQGINLLSPRNSVSGTFVEEGVDK